MVSRSPGNNGFEKTSILTLFSVTILSGDIHVADEKCIRNCIVLPHKELVLNYHNEIVM